MDVRKEVKRIVSKLKRNEISVYDIPEELEKDFEIITWERKLGYRETKRCGYDVVQDCFFVEEVFTQEDPEDIITSKFADFNSYAAYLEGNIYDNACYYLLPAGRTGNELATKNISRKAFIDYTIDDYNLQLISAQQQESLGRELKLRKAIKKWIAKFDNCTSYKELKQTVKNYAKSNLSESIGLEFYFWNYIFSNIKDQKRFSAILEYVSEGYYPSYIIRDALCVIYPADKTVNHYNYHGGSYRTIQKYNRELKIIAEKVKNNEYTERVKGYYDTKTTFYCAETSGYEKDGMFPGYTYKEYFETVDDLVKRLGGNLQNCDLSEAPVTDFDFSHCVIDDTTKLPFNPNMHYKYVLQKSYDNGFFYVDQAWKDDRGKAVKTFNHRFEYFFDFVFFLKGDLSKADLICCDGLIHLEETNDIVFKDALLSSKVAKKLNLRYSPYKFNGPSEISFKLSEKNENETNIVLHAEDRLAKVIDENSPDAYDDYSGVGERIYYISDLHLMHLLRNRKCETKNDIIRIARKLANTLAEETDYYDIILINGDISLDFSVFKIFVTALSEYERTIVFTLGNHDLWSCPNSTVDQISKKYRTLLTQNNMYLLHNEILYFTELGSSPKRITEHEISKLSETELRNRVRTSRLVLFGGTGFSGYNHDFNAEHGIYRYNKTIGYDKNIELRETQRFEKLYNKVRHSLYGKNVIVMTHMPIDCWNEQAANGNYTYASDSRNDIDCNHSAVNMASNSCYETGFIYLSGHTHKNYCYDDGYVRIYADNQFGYNNSHTAAWPHLKYIEIDNTFDYFSDYSDGIYEISSDEFINFYHGKNIRLDFNRKINILYMLKKENYYCFIHKNKNNQLNIMNGGALKRLPEKDIEYYYSKMDTVISLLKDPFNKYTKYQETLAENIQKIGGSGMIHGCIVDIDFFNHVYVNPFDGSVTSYWASDMINKLVYPSIPALLEAQCPKLYLRYKKMIAGGEGNNLPVLAETQSMPIQNSPQPYLNTDIYKASREIKKMQKLNSNILTVWPDKLPRKRNASKKVLWTIK